MIGLPGVDLACRQVFVQLGGNADRREADAHERSRNVKGQVGAGGVDETTCIDL
jgi:hypothetical protein